LLLYDVIRNGAEQFPDSIAIIFRDRAIRYGQLVTEVDRTAAALQSQGLRRGDAVALLLPNCPEFTFVYFAAAAIGALTVPANPLLKPPELEYIWADCRARMVVTVPGLVPGALEASAGVPGLPAILVVGDPAAAPAGTVSLTGIAAGMNPGPVKAGAVAEMDAAVCIYTSGTTGKPKGALLSHRNLLVNSHQVITAVSATPADAVICVLPLFHSFAATVCQNSVLRAGARMLLLEQFHPARTVEAIAAHRVTVFPAVPAMFAALLQFAGDQAVDFSSLRVCVSGGAPMPAPVMEGFEKKFGTIILEGDGPTECSPVTSVNPVDGVRKPGSIGLPVSGVEMRIFDDEDRELPVDEVGEIVVRGENVMLGYLNQPEATAQAMRSGWYHTGDLGKKDEDGYFYIVDRKKDMLIVGGINVYPREVEDVLVSHPGVLDAAVIGDPNPLKGEEVLAVVVRKPGAEVTELELVRHCRSRLANFKVPRRMIFRNTLPYSNTGKVLKRMLRKELDLGGQ
jgi:long-chain acyl-CoA synthetase